MGSLKGMEHLFGRLDPMIPNEILVLLLLLGVLIFIWDLLDRRSSQIRKTGGLGEKSEVVALKGSSYLPSREFVSSRLGISSRPHGLIREEGFIIPVDVNPLSKKIKDRHVVQMLVHLRLIEELEGTKPPYGILVMGPEARSVRIKNTDDKQRWLSTILDEMSSIVGGVPAIASPAFYKCRSCDVNVVCAQSAYKPEPAHSPEVDPEDRDG
jgi:CRISPR/Cas system-associated exonuclease Cas4 (RecB family)